MFLRTKCDRELYLSLHTGSELKAHGLPEPLQARPGIGILRDVGIDFEGDRNTLLRAAFGAAVAFATDQNGRITSSDMATLLGSSQSLPHIILQGKILPRSFQPQALANIGIDAALIPTFPPIDGMIPDVVVVRLALPEDEEVLPSGARGPINALAETRHALSVIDIKHTAEANPSYSAEVALYAFMLANWLHANGLQTQYFVTTRAYLWTRAKQGDSALQKLVSEGMPATPGDYLTALIADCEDINFRFYMPAVMRFFREDIPRVIQIGDANWRNLDWYVDSKCTACDWLGIGKWATSTDKAKIQALPDHYCLPNAELMQHLSRIAGVSRGARKTLELHAIADTSVLATTTGNEPAYKEHSLLKRDKSRLPLRASSLHTGTTSSDTQAVLASLAAFPYLQIFTAVNFDASAGLLTGLALSGRVTGYQTGQSPQFYQPVPFVVDQKTLDSEWVALSSFLSQIAGYIETASQYLRGLGITKPLSGQIAFWEKRQFEELCAAMGRHLPKVMALSDRKTKALAWMFPPDELIEKDAGAISPCIVFVEDIVRQFVFTPVPHVITLYDTVQHYHAGTSPPTLPDPYYREYLSNGVPRERIYEVWSGVAIVQRGNVSLPRTTVLTQFANALSMQCRALDSVVRKLRDDFSGRLKGEAPTIDLSVPSGARNVAFDSKLWIWWEKLEYATGRLESHSRLAADVDTLESSFQAIRLINRVGTSPNGNPIYSVSPDSTEVKLEDDDSYLAVGLCAEPGFPLEYVRKRIPSTAATYPGNPEILQRPFFSAINATLVNFDRANLRAEIRIEDRDNGALLPYLAAQANLDFSHDIFLTESKSAYKWYEFCEGILRLIGNPPIAVADQQAAKAMGLLVVPSGTDASTPPAEVLWTPDVLQSHVLLPLPDAQAVAVHAQVVGGLNPSQVVAVERAAHQRLTVMWGPPGTGKTRTLAALIKSLAVRKASVGKGLNILISGPTYKAVEELIGRLLGNLQADPTCPCDLFIAYSKSRATNTFPSAAGHLNVVSFNMIEGSPEWQMCANSLDDTNRVTIVATGVQQAYKIPAWQTGRRVAPVFDFVVLDESSQIPVTKAISALATLKPDAGLVVAGDHLQMPPIAILEPPVGAEYLVGSIQTYLLKRFPGVSTADLLENYRSAQTLVNYAKTLGYPVQLSANNPATRIHLLNPIPAPSTGFPAALPYSQAWAQALSPDHAALTILHDDELSSQSNSYEARMIAGLVYCLRMSVSAALDGRGSVTHQPPTDEQFWQECVGIVTPHRAQRALIVRELKSLFPNDLPQLIDSAVDTVEKFQGGERHVILVSFGVADGDVIAGEEVFLMQMERTNVAISRAMAKCIVVMPTTLAGHIPQDKRALLTAHAIKGYVDDFCSQASNIAIVENGQARHGKLRWAP
jgi:hypothetical protein